MLNRSPDHLAKGPFRVFRTFEGGNPPLNSRKSAVSCPRAPVPFFRARACRRWRGLAWKHLLLRPGWFSRGSRRVPRTGARYDRVTHMTHGDALL